MIIHEEDAKDLRNLNEKELESAEHNIYLFNIVENFLVSKSWFFKGRLDDDSFLMYNPDNQLHRTIFSFKKGTPLRDLYHNAIEQLDEKDYDEDFSSNCYLIMETNQLTLDDQLFLRGLKERNSRFFETFVVLPDKIYTKNKWFELTDDAKEKALKQTKHVLTAAKVISVID